MDKTENADYWQKTYDLAKNRYENKLFFYDLQEQRALKNYITSTKTIKDRRNYLINKWNNLEKFYSAKINNFLT